MDHQVNSNQFRINPLSNDLGWNLTSPTDNYAPQINDVFLEPIRTQANGVGSGYTIITNNGSISNSNENTVKIHYQNRPQGPTETQYVINDDQNSFFEKTAMNYE